MQNDEFPISIYKSKSLLWENMCKYSDRDLGGPSERLPGEKAWPPQTGNAGCLWWTPACSHRGHWRKAKTSIRHQMSRLLIYIYISKTSVILQPTSMKSSEVILCHSHFFFFFLNCKMQSIKIDNMHKWHKNFFHFSWLQTMLFIRLSPLQSNNTSKEDCSFNSFKMKNIGLSRIL